MVNAPDSGSSDLPVRALDKALYICTKNIILLTIQTLLRFQTLLQFPRGTSPDALEIWPNCTMSKRWLRFGKEKNRHGKEITGV